MHFLNNNNSNWLHLQYDFCPLFSILVKTVQPLENTELKANSIVKMPKPAETGTGGKLKSWHSWYAKWQNS